jgi:Protein-tyrosine-phosphatase
MRILFVCTGNICRSAFAETYLRARLGPDSPVTVSSAGTMAVVGHDLEEQMAARAELMDLPYIGHTARQLTGRILAAADLVLVFEEHHLTWVLDERPEMLTRTLSLGQAAAGLGTLPPTEYPTWDAVAPRVLAVRPAPLPEDWVPDPYRHGAGAAARASHRIVEDIDQILSHIAPASDS